MIDTQVVEQHRVLTPQQGVNKAVQDMLEQQRAEAQNLLPHSDYFSSDIFNSVSDLKKQLLKSGLFQENFVQYLTTVILPEGHPEHMSMSRAGKHFFPGLAESAIDRLCRKALGDLIQTALFTRGDLLNYRRNTVVFEENKPKRPRKVAVEGEEKKPRKQYEKREATDKAQAIATHVVMAAFRKKNNLPARGKIDSALQNAKDLFLKEHLQGEYDKALEALKNAPPRKRRRKAEAVHSTM